MKFNILFTILPLLLEQVLAQMMPTISFISERQVVNVGGSVNLVCSVDNANTSPVYWMKLQESSKQSIILTFRMFRITKDERFSMNYKIGNSSTYTLQIENIQESDEGFYRCAVQMSESYQITSTIELKVERKQMNALMHYLHKAPEFCRVSTQNLTVKEVGSLVILECIADGFPKPMIFWGRGNGMQLPISSISNGNMFIIRSIKREDAGIYYCVAANEYDESIRHNMTVIIESEINLTNRKS